MMTDCDEQKRRRSEQKVREEKEKAGARTTSGEGVPGKRKTKRTGGENITRGKEQERAGRERETRPPSTRRTRQGKRKGTRGAEE